MIFRYSRFQVSISIQITESLQDSGYQGIAAYHANSYVPLKKPQHGELTSLQREYNRALSQERMGIEHINRSLRTCLKRCFNPCIPLLRGVLR